MVLKYIECPKDKIKIKCPNAMSPTRIVIHNTANDASAENEVKYMHSNNNETSFHFAVDDIQAVQGIEIHRNAWHAGDGNGKGNREGIAIEICYSKSGGEKWLKAVNNAAQLTAELLYKYKWDISKVTKHQDYSGKHCPHRILDEYGWDNFLELVKNKLYMLNGAYKKEPKPITNPMSKKVSVTYQVWDGKKKKWLPNVIDTTDYAGIYGNSISAIYANLSSGNIFYKTHYRGGKWLPEVKNRTDYAGIYARPIDGLMIRTDTGRTVHYQVHLKRKNKWLPYVTGYNEKDENNGYAGIIGQDIDAIRIYID